MALDDLFVSEKLAEEEKQYLEKFKKLKRLAMNGIGLKSLDNFPEIEGLIYVRNSFF